MMPSPSIKYKKGTRIGAIYSSSPYLNIHEGNGVIDFLDGGPKILNQPQVWNGAVQYRVEDVTRAAKRSAGTGCESHLTTSYEDNIGSFGNMFDITTRLKYTESIYILM